MEKEQNDSAENEIKQKQKTTKKASTTKKRSSSKPKKFDSDKTINTKKEQKKNKPESEKIEKIEVEKPIEQKIIEKTDQPEIKTKKSWKKVIILIIILIFVLGIGACYQYFSGTLDKIIDKDGNVSLYQQIDSLLRGNDKPLQGELEDRINILLLGMGGSHHSGGTLTDTIMIASIKPSTNQVALISLPRDLVVKVYDDDNPGWFDGKKINFMYEIGGLELSVEKVQEVTGLDIHYYILSDFSGFIKMINDVGDVEVDVANRFNGYYHIADVGGTCEGAAGGPVYLAEGDGPYCIFRFYKGSQKMDGETALMFSRIRKVAYSAKDNEYYEGSDFARAKRQQQILEAFREKVFSASTIANPIKMTKIIDDLGDHLKTNMELWEIAKLIKMAENFNKEKIINQVIDENGGLVEGYIYPETGAFVIVPTIGEYNFSEIQELTTNIFTQAETDKQIEEIKEEIKTEEANIMVLNGTNIEGLAGRTKNTLENNNINILEIGNAPAQTSTTTKIYDLTQNNPQTLEALMTQLNTTKNLPAEEFDIAYPEHEIDTSDYDFIIVLGTDQETS